MTKKEYMTPEAKVIAVAAMYTAPSPSADPNVDKVIDANGNNGDFSDFTTADPTTTAPTRP